MTLALDLNRVERLLCDNGVEVQGRLQMAKLSGGRSNMTFTVSDGRSTWVARRPPLTGLTSSAHDMLREYTVVAALGKTSVPVPAAIACDPDGTVTGSPLCVVDFVAGRAVRDRDHLDGLTDDQVAATVRRLIQTPVNLHGVDIGEVGLTSFGRQWNSVKTRDLADIDRLIEALVGRTAPEAAASIVHGDYRIDNTLLNAEHAETVAAVLDWEMSTLGDPLTDVALMCAYRCEAFADVLGAAAAWTSPRLPPPEAIAQMYADASGRDLSGWGHYMALANLKVAVIAEGIAYRAMAAPDQGGEGTRAARATPQFAAAGLRALR